MKTTRALIIIGILVPILSIFVVSVAKRFGLPTGGRVYERTFITANPIDLTQIRSISKFRSCVGHDYSGSNTEGQVETNRSMKHYIEPLEELAGSVQKVKIFAPFDGNVGKVEEENGKQVWLESSTSNGFIFIFFHVELLDGIKKGTRVKSGQHLGYADLQRGANFDVGLKKFRPFSNTQILDSVFIHMNADVLREYEERGIKREEMVLSKQYRDSKPCEFGVGSGSDEWVILK